MESRFETLKVSKFNTLSNEELEEVMGGICVSCRKRERMIEIEINLPGDKDKPASEGAEPTK